MLEYPVYIRVTMCLSKKKRNEAYISRLDWLFIPYNFRQEERIIKLKKNLREEFGREIADDELESLWKKDIDDARDKIRKAYKGIPGGLNVNSMTLFSGTKDDGLEQKLVKCHECYYCRYNDRFRPPGCLYTGDYDASGNYKWKKLSSAYSKYRKHIGCIQLPHHGAKDSFNDGFLDMNCFYVISAGSRNKYQHPHSIVIKKFLFKDIMPFIVSEQADSAKYFLIY